jgi:hypothetical protein
MSDPGQPRRSARLASRVAGVSAAVMLGLSIALRNDLLPFLGLAADVRIIVANALVAVGLLDLGAAIFLQRRAR